MMESPAPVKTFQRDKLRVEIYRNRSLLGRAAAIAAAGEIRSLLARKGNLSIVFASAPSQTEFLAELSSAEGILWSRVTAFHLDEYVGLPDDAPQNFGNFLRLRIFQIVNPGMVHYINGNAPNLEEECRRYSDLLKQHPLDVACIGIGENGHIAFNDPPFVDFDDPSLIKIVQPDLTSRIQQVHDGCFDALEKVPVSALSLTIPAVMSAKAIFCMVPAPTKAAAVKKTLEWPITTDCPASVLRRHQRATLFLDMDSAGLLAVDSL